MNEIKIIKKGTVDTSIIKMSEMKILQIGVIIPDDDKFNYNYCVGDIVMRTQSLSEFEVMNLSRPGPENCWSCPNVRIKVKLLPEARIEVIL